MDSPNDENYSQPLEQYWCQLEERLTKIEEDIKNETFLIGSSVYSITTSGSKCVSVGISPSAGYIPIVKLFTPTTCVYFTKEEWSEFCKEPGNHVRQSWDYDNKKIIRISSRKAEIILSLEVNCNLDKLQHVIGEKLRILQESNFVEFYKDMLNYCSKTNGDLYADARVFISNQKCLNSFWLLELLHFSFNQVYLDYKYVTLNDD